ncbi:MAG: GIY-YIG nuclease family protein [Gemmataceae bacterium]|nr:GIY-YIG nuclease family protein [Gemmataceae bacterium]MCI0741576.1 GIY-YIG nuclease family protein [Gemmataceae bacterium]
MNSPLIEAYLAVPGLPSADAVVADPQINKRFIRECRKKGLVDPVRNLNLRLLNARKAKDLQGLRKSKRIILPNQDDFRFASEIAARFLERRDDISLDQIICDPAKVSEFDRIAAKLSPGLTPFAYRWAALSLRKRRQLEPQILARIIRLIDSQILPIRGLELPKVTTSQGLYKLFTSKETLYIGECQNLRKRIGKHLDHSTSKGLAHWLWKHGNERVFLEIQVLPDKTPTRHRRALETEAIRTYKPLFNIGGA